MNASNHHVTDLQHMTKEPADPSLAFAAQLKASTRSEHEGVDHHVMAAEPFSSLSHYEKFLRLQHRFHGIIHDLYHHDTLNQWLPGLNELPRLEKVEADLAALDLAIPERPTPLKDLHPETALGWLYCSEGSNLGAAFLFKETQKMGLTETHGASHLAAHPEGRGLHWRQFVAQMNALPLSSAQQTAGISGARQAFAFYRQALNEIFQPIEAA